MPAFLICWTCSQLELASELSDSYSFRNNTESFKRVIEENAPLTGPWDHMVFFRLEGGLADAEIANTSQMEKWNTEFQIQEGGPEKSQLAQA